uniref:Uncharacterized protein n=1 Tax=Anguilla anguilla TaxID=7936 RepID=A0A0E9S4S9_ANGAN
MQMGKKSKLHTTGSSVARLGLCLRSVTVWIKFRLSA